MPEHDSFRGRKTAPPVILTVNSGSTSVKLAAFEVADAGKATLQPIASQRYTGETLQPASVLYEFLRSHGISAVSAVGHRVVHGGPRFSHAVRIDEHSQAAIDEMSELAPLHNPAAVKWITATRTQLPPDVIHVAVFDTAFFAQLPRVAAEYALPRWAGTDLGVRRYGFHGIAHEALWRRWCELNPGLQGGGRLITVQLGGGCSLAAIASGQPLDTSMGFSPLEGLVMTTRSGDLDPAAVPYIARRLGRTCDAVIDLLNNESGVLGVSGSRKNVSELAREPDSQSQFAVELYCYRVRKYIGAYLAVLGGCDGIVFGGGIGEHAPEVRARILRGMEWAGITLDTNANASAIGSEACISAAGSISVYVIPVDEERALAEAALSHLQRAAAPAEPASPDSAVAER